ncbi:hypothetical protein C1703_03085 [Streptomyces sp. Go-475]|nr:hypothetical protein C1703_03085 [Streptomyces sp. Go-475]
MKQARSIRPRTGRASRGASALAARSRARSTASRPTRCAGTASLRSPQSGGRACGRRAATPETVSCRASNPTAGRRAAPSGPQDAYWYTLPLCVCDHVRCPAVPPGRFPVPHRDQVVDAAHEDLTGGLVCLGGGLGHAGFADIGGAAVQPVVDGVVSLRGLSRYLEAGTATSSRPPRVGEPTGPGWHLPVWPRQTRCPRPPDGGESPPACGSSRGALERHGRRRGARRALRLQRVVRRPLREGKADVRKDRRPAVTACGAVSRPRRPGRGGRPLGPDPGSLVDW